MLCDDELSQLSPLLEQPGYFHSPWACEDGGPRRLQIPRQLKGLNIQPGEQLTTVAGRRSITGTMVLLREPGEVYLMHVDTIRGRYFKRPCYAHIERIDPVTLKTIQRSPPLPGGPWWPGGFSIHRNGDIYVTFGRYTHRLTPDLNIVASFRHPFDLPYNSHVVLDNGYLVAKPISDTGQTSLSVLDEHLNHTADFVPLPEPSIARISARGNCVYVVGVRSVFRFNFDTQQQTLVRDESWSYDYISNPNSNTVLPQSYGWDAVISENNAWFIDNGKHTMEFSMRGNGVNPTPNRVHRVNLNNATDHQYETISGIDGGTITNPPVYCPVRKILVAFDSANAVVTAYRYNGDNKLTPIWNKPSFCMGGHTIYYPDTGELITSDHRGALRNEDSVVLDIETGLEKARHNLHNFMQTVVFSCPGWERDFYWLSLDRLVHIQGE